MHFRNYNLHIQPYKLKFNFIAKTSKNTLKHHDIIVLCLLPNKNDDSRLIQEPFHYSHLYPHGEISPIKHLSRDFYNNSEFCSTKTENIINAIKNLNDVEIPKNIPSCLALAQNLINSNEMPSLCFALETLFLDFCNSLSNKKKCIFDSDFYLGQPTKTNGLVWINDIKTMKSKIFSLIENGYKCIKIKVGLHSIDKELELIASIRKKYGKEMLELRLDANGAFDYETASEILLKLKLYHIHSIEQPIPQGNIDLMARLVNEKHIPIALDEELIFASTLQEKIEIIKYVKPDYIILKPQLLGGFYNTQKIIEAASTLNVKWWITSALESNIGLNAIAQFQSYMNSIYPSNLAQGLGTGTLYSNNFSSPLILKSQNLHFLNS